MVKCNYSCNYQEYLKVHQLYLKYNVNTPVTDETYLKETTRTSPTIRATIDHRTQEIWNGNGPQFFLTQRALHLELQNFNWYSDRYDNKVNQISKILNAPYGFCIHFSVWPQMTSRGFQRSNTSFLLKFKKM